MKLKDRWALIGAAVPRAALAGDAAVRLGAGAFAVAAAAMIPLAGLLGDATEELAAHAGPSLGGLLNATFGNAAELIIAIVDAESQVFFMTW